MDNPTLDSQIQNHLATGVAASMAHELRTPLNAILGFTGTLLMKLPGPLNPEQEKQLMRIKDAANNLLNMLNDVIDAEKLINRSYPKTTSDVIDVVTEINSAIKIVKTVHPIDITLSAKQTVKINCDDQTFVRMIIIILKLLQTIPNNKIHVDVTTNSKVNINFSGTESSDQFKTSLKESIEKNSQNQLPRSTTHLGFLLLSKFAALANAKLDIHFEPNVNFSVIFASGAE